MQPIIDPCWNGQYTHVKFDLAHLLIEQVKRVHLLLSVDFGFWVCVKGVLEHLLVYVQ